MTKERLFIILSATFCVCLIASNIFENVIFEAGPLTLTGGFLVFPLSYIINDFLSEIYGFKQTRRVIFLAFALNLAFVLIAQLVAILPESPMSGNGAQEHFAFIFRADLRITAASMAAFLTGSLTNSLVMGRLKARRGDEGFCSRAIVSSLAGETLDSIVFFPIAFHGVGFRNMLVLMVTQVVLKTAYEIVILPLTAFLVRKARKSA